MSSDLKLDLNYFENILVYQSLTNTSYLADIIEYIKLDYFNNNDIRVVFKVIKEYYKQYHKAPNASELVQYLVSDEQKEAFKKVIQTSKTLDKNISYDEIIINTERFLGERAVYTTMMDIAGDFKNLDISNVYQRFHDACNIRLYEDLGLDFYRDVDKLVDYLGTPNPTISTGFTWLDQKLGGGYLEEGKALYIFVGQPNVGKSIFLGNAATTIASQGKNVLLVSLEMSEMMYATRLASKLTKIPIAELRNRKDEIKHILEGKERGKIIIKEFPPSTLSPEQLENYYKTVVDSGIKIDVMVLDYINLLRGKASAQSYEKIKEIAEQVRAIAVKHGISVLSATQKNRQGVNNIESDMTTVSESMGLPATADAMFDISQTEEDKELGIVRLGMMKNRFGPNFGKVALRVDWNTLDIYEDSSVNAVESTLETYSALEKFNQS
nr:MAG TPA: DnaB-like replicative helicase [Caudoviricetes sp.]DAT07159.1 MAG TPA: DnaB-like replicative helicase [Caudoviricetes sp.]